MTDLYPPAVQRPALLAFAKACDTRSSALRRDECGDWAIFGNNGHIFAVPLAPPSQGQGFQLMVGCDPEPRWSSAKGWESAKRRLSFAKVTQDGDEEGAFILDRLPTKAEATQIRQILGIPKRVKYSEGTLAAKRAQFSTVRELKAVLPPRSDEAA